MEGLNSAMPASAYDCTRLCLCAQTQLVPPARAPPAEHHAAAARRSGTTFARVSDSRKSPQACIIAARGARYKAWL